MRISFLCLLAVAVAGLATMPLRADPIHWNYSAGSLDSPLRTTSPGFPEDSSDGIDFIGSGQHHLTGSRDVLLVQMQAFWGSNFDGGYFNGAAPFNTYRLRVFLNDEASHTFKDDILFSGKIVGGLSPDSISITNTFTGPTTQSVLLGQNLYTVTLTEFNSPGSPNSGDLGSIWAHVDVQPTPEPSTLLLAGLGLPLLGGLLWRRQRQHRRPLQPV